MRKEKAGGAVPWTLDEFARRGRANQAAVDELGAGAGVKISLSSEHARALHWLVRHLAFSDALESTPPHLGKAVRQERAYGIIHAASALQDALEKAEHFGDGWMYSDGGT